MNTTNYLKFPLKIDSQGQIGTESEDDYIEGLIEQVLFTNKRGRVNRPHFGVSLRKTIFDTLDTQVMNTSHDLIQTQLQQNLGHLITVNNIDIVESESTRKISIAYTVNTNQNQQLTSFQRSASPIKP